jgi:hypothetical protein
MQYLRHFIVPIITIVLTIAGVFTIFIIIVFLRYVAGKTHVNEQICGRCRLSCLG